jgi:hypothetical protein
LGACRPRWTLRSYLASSARANVESTERSSSISACAMRLPGCARSMTNAPFGNFASAAAAFAAAGVPARSALPLLGRRLGRRLRPHRARALGGERLLHPLHLDARVLEVLGERCGAHRIVADVERVGTRRVRARRARGVGVRRHALEPLLAKADRGLDRGQRRGEVPRHAVEHGDDGLVVPAEREVAAAVGLVGHADRALERGPDVPVLGRVEVEHVAHVVLPAVAVERRRVPLAEAVHPHLVVVRPQRGVGRVGGGREEERRHLPVVVHEHLRPPAADLARHLP